ncbi:MAG TPA: PAS domain S-box protein [Candidatus Hydrogenedentes bacterium]|nr:PAS domain S-box protein [Candidatus Hydrogenedentota bacterium]
MPDIDDPVKETAEDLAALRAEVELQRRRAAAHAELHRRDAQFYQMLVESLTEGLVILDEQDHFAYINQMLLNMMGYSQEEVFGHHPLEFAAPEFRELLQEEMNRRRTGARQHYELVCHAKNGSAVTILVAPSPILDDHGAYCGAFAVITDLTARIRTEEALERERTRLKTIMEHLPDSVYVKDVQGRYVEVNQAKLQSLGLSGADEILGKTALDIFPEEQARQFHEQDLHVIRSGKPMLNVISQVPRAGQSAVWESSSKAPLRDSSGTVIGMVDISRDISAEREAQTALRQSEERFREILDHTRDIAYKVNLRTGQFEYLSPSVAALLKRTPDEIIVAGFKGVEAMIHPEDLERYHAHHLSLLESVKQGEAVGFWEYRIRRKDGVYRWFSENASLILDDTKKPIARVGTLRDITHRKQAEEAVRAASRMEATATLAGGIAHDFNNLMTAVLGNAELLELKFSNDAAVLKKLHTISEAAVRAGTLAQQMLAFARGGKYQPAVTNLNEVIEHVMLFEEHSVPQNVQVVRDLAPDLWNTFSDAVQIGQVIMNLTMNAIEALDGAGTITLSTGNRILTKEDCPALLAPGRYVWMAVKDTGPGMSENVRARVFEPFFTTKFQGRGLGLAAAYGIVKNHGGYIGADNLPGKGAIFEVFLPATECTEKVKPPLQEKLPLGSETVLIADDEPEVLNSFREVLQRLGYSVITVEDGVQAIEVARSHPSPIHAVILDMAMPNMGGEEAFGPITRLLPKAKILICSGYDLGPAVQRLLDEGARAFLRKPVRVAELATELRRALDE